MRSFLSCVPAFLALMSVCCTSNRVVIPLSPPDSGFTEVSCCSEIPNVASPLKDIAVGDAIAKVESIPPRYDETVAIRVPPEEWGEGYLVRWDAQSDTLQYFFHDGPVITHIAYAWPWRFLEDCFSRVSSCAEIPGVTQRLRNVSVGSTVDALTSLISTLPGRSGPWSRLVPPKKWGEKYEVCWDGASKTNVYFFHDAKYIRRIAYTSDETLFLDRINQLQEIKSMSVEQVDRLWSRPRFDLGGALILEEK